MDVDVGETPTYGPDLPPRTGGHELEVLEVQLAQRALLGADVWCGVGGVGWGIEMK